MTTTTRRPGPFANSTGPILSSGRPALDSGPEPVETRDPRYDNQPPLGERIAMEFEEDLQKDGLIERVATLEAAAGRAPKVDGPENAGKVGDFIKQAKALENALEAVREKHNRPLIDARTALKTRTDGLFSPIAQAVQTMRDDLNRWTREENARVERERREAEETAARLRREAEIAAAEKEAQTGISADHFIPEIAPRRVEAPVARGDYGARVGSVTRYEHTIDSVRQLPDRLLNHPKVLEALNKIIAAEIRSASGKCTIKGVTITPVTAAAVR